MSVLMDLAEKLDLAQSRDEIGDILDEANQSLGFAGTCFRCFPNSGAENQETMFAKTDGLEPDFERALASTPAYLDPFLQAGLRKSRAFMWDDIEELLNKRSPQFRQFERLAKFGPGIIVPVYGPLHRNGYFCFVFDAELNEAELFLNELQLISQVAYLRVCDLLFQSRLEEKALSRRELDIMNLVAKGYSNQRISEELDIAPTTVGTYVRRIFEKLHVNDKTSATMRAFALGYIV